MLGEIAPADPREERGIVGPRHGPPVQQHLEQRPPPPVVPLFVEQRPLLGHALACQQLAHTARRLYDIFDEPCDEPDEPLADAGIQNAALDRRALTVPVRARRIREPWSKRAIRL